MKNCLVGIICLFLTCPLVRAADYLDREIQLPKAKETTYELLNRISEASGYFFIYDSNAIQNEKKVKINKGVYTIRQAILLAVDDKSIQMRVIGRHILLSKKKEPEVLTKQVIPVSDTLVFITLKGILRDAQTKDPIPYVSVSVDEAGIGTIANQSGEFVLKIPDSLRHCYTHFSHIGYKHQVLPAELLVGETPDVYMQTNIVPLREVIVGLVNPLKIVKEMLNNRPLNYRDDPVYLTTFYREGIERKSSFVNLSEAVFQIYKTGYESTSDDQVKLLKMRKISNEKEQDSVILKMRAGINASLYLDLVKYLPNFLELSDANLFDYTKIDMVVTDSSLAHVIAFEQKDGVDEPLYKGQLYIDADNSALLSATFEVNPHYIDKATDIFVLKKPKEFDIKPQSANYTVTYRQWYGTYYINHIRGDLTFKLKKKKQILPSTKTVHVFFEMATCKIDTANVKRFPRNESIPTRNIFSETRFQYDENFWGDFNVIPPEEELNEAIRRVSSKIEESNVK